MADLSPSDRVVRSVYAGTDWLNAVPLHDQLRRIPVEEGARRAAPLGTPVRSDRIASSCRIVTGNCTIGTSSTIVARATAGTRRSPPKRSRCSRAGRVCTRDPPHPTQSDDRPQRVSPSPGRRRGSRLAPRDTGVSLHRECRRHAVSGKGLGSRSGDSRSHHPARFSGARLRHHGVRRTVRRCRELHRVDRRAIRACAGAGGGRVVVPADASHGARAPRATSTCTSPAEPRSHSAATPRTTCPLTRFEGTELMNVRHSSTRSTRRTSRSAAKARWTVKRTRHTGGREGKRGVRMVAGAPNYNAARQRPLRWQRALPSRNASLGRRLDRPISSSRRCKNVLIENVSTSARDAEVNRCQPNVMIVVRSTARVE